MNSLLKWKKAGYSRSNLTSGPFSIFRRKMSFDGKYCWIARVEVSTKKNTRDYRVLAYGVGLREAKAECVKYAEAKTYKGKLIGRVT